jgi:hypothetical protein
MVNYKKNSFHKTLKNLFFKITRVYATRFLKLEFVIQDWSYETCFLIYIVF